MIRRFYEQATSPAEIEGAKQGWMIIMDRDTKTAMIIFAGTRARARWVLEALNKRDETLECPMVDDD